MSGGWKSAELADKIRAGEVDANIEAVLSDEKELGDVLLACERGGVDDEDGLYALLARQSGTDALRGARRSGDANTMNAATGLGDSSVDMSDWQQMEAVKDFFRSPPVVRKDLTNTVFQCVVFSSNIPPTGRGKSSTGYWLVENAKIVDPNMSVMTNNPSDEFRDVPEQWDDLKSEIRAEDGWSLVMLDEAAQFLQYADQGAGKAVSQLMKLLRHNQCHLILIGHTGMDVPADIRRQMYFIDKPSKKTAVIGHGLTGKSGDNRMQVANELLKLSGVPHTTVDYKSQGEEAIEIKFDDDDDADDPDAGEDQLCRATTNAGDPCPQTARFPAEDPVVCHGHRGKLDEFTRETEPPETPPVGDVTKGLEDTFSALNAARGASEGDEEDERLIADALAADGDMEPEEAERIAAELIDNDDDEFVN